MAQARIGWALGTGDEENLKRMLRTVKFSLISGIEKRIMFFGS